MRFKKSSGRFLCSTLLLGMVGSSVSSNMAGAQGAGTGVITEETKGSSNRASSIEKYLKEKLDAGVLNMTDFMHTFGGVGSSGVSMHEKIKFINAQTEMNTRLCIEDGLEKGRLDTTTCLANLEGGVAKDIETRFEEALSEKKRRLAYAEKNKQVFKASIEKSFQRSTTPNNYIAFMAEKEKEKEKAKEQRIREEKEKWIRETIAREDPITTEEVMRVLDAYVSRFGIATREDVDILKREMGSNVGDNNTQARKLKREAEKGLDAIEIQSLIEQFVNGNQNPIGPNPKPDTNTNTNAGSNLDKYTVPGLVVATVGALALGIYAVWTWFKSTGEKPTNKKAESDERGRQIHSDKTVYIEDEKPEGLTSIGKKKKKQKTKNQDPLVAQ